MKMKASCSPLQAPSPVGTEEGLADTQSAGCKLEGKRRTGQTALRCQPALGKSHGEGHSREQWLSGRRMGLVVWPGLR